MRAIFILLFSFITFTVSATDYFVSNNGNDANDGLTEASSWKTLNKVNSKMSIFKSGDIIAFKGGDEFFGLLKIGYKNDLIFTSYGVGKATIKGSKAINGWTNISSNIWELSTGKDDVFNLFENKSPLNLARLPNLLEGEDNPKNYLKVSSVQNSKNDFNCADLVGYPDLTGATIFIQTEYFRLESFIIKSFSSSTGKITLNNNVKFEIDVGDNFFITNQYSLLSTQNEWYYDSNVKKLYVYSLVSPNDLEASLINDHGISINNSNGITVNNLNIINFTKDAIHVRLSNNCEIANNDINHCYNSGVYILSSKGTNVSNNYIKNSVKWGVATEDGDFSVIEGNTIENIFLLKNISSTITYGWDGIKINSFSDNVTVRRNIIKNVGYNGINIAKSSNTLVEENFIENFCLSLSDGGGIYLYSSPSNIGNVSIKKNILIGYDAFVNKEHMAHGIYLDDHCHNATIFSNSISNVHHGIFLHNAHTNTIKYNNIYNTKADAIFLRADSRGTEFEMVNNKIHNNKVFVTKNADSPPDGSYANITPVAFGLKTKWAHYDFGTYDNNKYFAIGTLTPVSIETSLIKSIGFSNVKKRMLLNEWTSYTGEDANSINISNQLENFNLISYDGTNLIANGDFTSVLDGWQVWNTLLTIKSEYLNIVTTGNTGSAITSSFTIENNREYLFEFDANIENTSTIQVYISPKDDINNPYQKHLIDIIPGWHTYKIPFTKNIGDKIVISFATKKEHGRLDIDNLKFKEVTFETLESNSYFAYNKEKIIQSISLPSGTWESLDGEAYSGSISLEPFTSKILTISDRSVGSVKPSAGADVAICNGESATLTASGGSTYLWSTGATTASITVSPTSTQTYTVTATDSSGNSGSDDVMVTVNSATAYAGANVTINEGESTTLTASGGDSYSWSTGATTQSITVNPTATKGYTVTVTKNGCQDTDRVTVTVNPIIIPVTASAGADVSICNGESATLRASGGATYLWSTGAATASITVSPSSTKTYTVTATDGSGNSNSDDVIVTVNTVTANAGANVTINEGESTTLTATGGDTYSWSNGATTQSITVSPTATKGYTVTATKNGCQDTDRVKVTVNPAIVPVTASAGADVAICNGESAALTASGGATYLWSTGATTASITVSPTTTKTYTVTATDGSGNTDSDDVIVTVNSVIANAGANVTINEGESTILTASGGDSYSWSNGATTQSITVSPAATKGYTVTVTKNGCQDTDRVTITVNPATVPVTASAGVDVAICNGESTTLTASGGATYVWSTGATSTSITVSPTSTKTYTVTATDGSGNSDNDDVIVTVNSVTANAGANVTINEGESTTLTASGGDTYSWSNGATTQSIAVSPAATKGYTVTVTKNGCQDTDRVTVTVNPIIIPVTASAGADVAICKGESATLTANGGATYLWSTGATTTSITVSPSSTKTYTVTATDGSGNTGSDDVIVTVNSATANAGANVTITEGESITLTASGGDTYSWSNGATTQSITVSPTATRGYTVTITKNGCQDTDRVTVTVNPATVPAIASAGADVAICNGESATLTASGGATYLWSTGATTASITVSPSSTKTYTVTASDGSGNTDSDDVLVTVNSVTADAGADKMINVGQTVKLTASGGDTYLWSTGQTTKSITVTPSTTKDYTVTVYENGCQDTDEVTVFVAYDVTNPPPADAFAGDDMSICLGESVTLNASGGETYTWSTGDTKSNIDVNPTRTTTYTLSATRGGITDTDTVTVSVENCNISALPEDVSLGEISIYPNPTTGLVNIKIPDLSSDMNVELISSNGSLVYKESINKKSNGFYKIDLSRRLAKGVYFMRLFNADEYFVEKIILN